MPEKDMPDTDGKGNYGIMKEKKTKERPSACTSCGGQLIQKDPYTYECASCGRKYYISADRVHKVSVRLSAGKMILICALCAIAVTGIAVAGYQYYTGRLVKSASRFSVCFRDFLMKAYQRPIAEIKEEDLRKMKYLKIEKDGEYIFTYSFEDFYDYRDEQAYEKTLHTISEDGKKDDFSPTNIQYFTGLTRLELYTEAWENYILPEENVLRSIYCLDGLSRNGTPQFFSRANPDTLEEVVIMEADDLEDFSFMEYLKGVKTFAIHQAKLKSGDMFQGFNRLENLILYQVDMEEDETDKIVENLLSLPSLKRFHMEGKTAWYIEDEQWEEWQQKYEGKMILTRE